MILFGYRETLVLELVHWLETVYVVLGEDLMFCSKQSSGFCADVMYENEVPLCIKYIIVVLLVSD